MLNNIKNIPKRLLAALPPAALALLLSTPVTYAAKGNNIPTLKPVKGAPGQHQVEKVGGVALWVLELGALVGVAVAAGTIGWRYFGSSELGGGMKRPLILGLLSLVGLGVLTDLNGFTAGWTKFFGF